MRFLGWAAALVGIAVLPFIVTSPYYLHLLITIAIFAILTLGLDIVFGYTGEVSIGHASLLGIGAYTAGVLSFQFGIGFWPALPLAIIVASLFGAVLAFPALRVTGPYLAMVTLAFGTIVQILINEATEITNGPLGIKLNTPLFFDIRPLGTAIPLFKLTLKRMKDVEFFYVVAIALMLTVLFINRVIASRFGRAFEALRDSPIACDCMGVSVYRHKVIAFVLSAALAGLAGALFAYSEQYIAPNNFSFELSILFLLAVTMGGRKSRFGPILGAAIIVFLPNLLADIALFRLLAGVIAAVAVATGAVVVLRRPEARARIAVPVLLCIAFFVFSLLLQSITDYKLAVFGMMILFVVFYLPDGIVGFAKTAVLSLNPRWSRTEVTASAAPAAGEGWRGQQTIHSEPAAVLLGVNKIVMRFGGLKALDGVDLAVRPGTIHGLIGPNGSGKSTMMNVLTGIYVPTEGQITFGQTSIAGLKSPEIARRGVARTFQNVQLFGELSLIQNVLVGLHHTFRAGLFAVASSMPGARREEAQARERALAILRFVGLEQLADEEARNLPYGKQRLLEIGRALALDPELLLLDEPAAGLTPPDIAELIVIIRRIRDAGITVVLIEHHMDLVMGICDTVSVLDFGQKIAEGTPTEVQGNSRVIEAYLGGTAAQPA